MNSSEEENEKEITASRQHAPSDPCVPRYHKRGRLSRHQFRYHSQRIVEKDEE
jgi:hypothetical protein